MPQNEKSRKGSKKKCCYNTILKSAALQGKLDGYREDKRRGKELNEDQKAAVAKYEFQLENLLTYLQPPDRYDEVVGTLDFARELTGQFTKLASDDAKDKKKQAKREQQEKARQELAKVCHSRSRM